MLVFIIRKWDEKGCRGMRKNRQKILAGLAMLLLILNMGLPIRAEDEQQRNRYNVVFVTDESGSMRSTDPNQLRYEAIKCFNGLAAQTGNYMGSISFNEGIVSEQNIQAVEGFEEKNAFSENVVVETEPGWTNIGLAINRAVDMLDNGKNEMLPSAIILLTDGNTDMESEEEEEASLAEKADALERARQAGYKIYTICLNKDGSADASEMQQIASATGGEFTEISDSEDLSDVMKMYYKMIFAGIDPDPNPSPVIIDENGRAEKVFEVPEVGIEEINIIFEGTFDTYEVVNPDGDVYSAEELQEMSMQGKNFTLVKILNPIGGPWKAVVYGEQGASITFKLLYNSAFELETTIDPVEGYTIGSDITFNAQIRDMNGIVDDISKYDGFQGVVNITHNNDTTKVDMELEEDGFTCQYTIPEDGTYYASVTVSNSEMTATSDETYEINVNNRPPVAPEETPSAHVNLWPFIGGTAKLDLEGTATDPDNEKLEYTIESSAFNEDEYELDGTVLRVDGFSIPKGSFTIRATDPHGGYCTYDVLITSTNIGLIMAIAIVVGGLLVLVVLGVIVYKKKFIPFMGTITVEKYDDNSGGYIQPVSLTPGRGSVQLESFVAGTGFPKGCKFQAGGKDKNIYFRSKKPVYSNITAGPVKKIKIEGSGSEVRISPNQDMNKGITVTFKSILYNQFF